MENRLIVTRADENHDKISQLTHPILKQYAERCEADFLVLKEPYKNFHIHYRILQLYELFDKYDRILSVDTDIIILNKCPNIFDVVKQDTIASIYEDVGSRQLDRRGRIQAMQTKFGDIGWTSGYINTGFALFPKIYRDLFKVVSSDELWVGLGFDDVFLSYRINKFKYAFQELSYMYNFMSMFSEEWNGNVCRSNAYVIHYAGSGGFLTGRSRDDIIKEDIILFRKYGAL